MNYATAGSSDKPALLLVPGQSESWWGYEMAMWLLKDDYQVFAVDMRGQGQSTWTPGRYSLDTFGNDLVKFIDIVIKRPVVVSGLSSGGVVSAWLSAFAKPGQIRAAVYEDPPLFASQSKPAIGQSVMQTVAGPFFNLWYKWLGAQWTIGDQAGMVAAMPKEIPAWILQYLGNTTSGPTGLDLTLNEYDPEWGHGFVSGTVDATCDHEAMLTHVKVPVLFTHHSRAIDPYTGNLIGSVSDTQVSYAQGLITTNGNQSFTLKNFPLASHDMHNSDPATYVSAITTWMASLGIGSAVIPGPVKVASASAQVSAASTAPPSCTSTSAPSTGH
ncbi:putative hydrolase protein [Phaeoacremonium minimum UCRPA7]|uniref:Putative hydrolase protein n=1 Tax=Phaeoacremonium minimum (strain UCR-PA7) TaxID=1286976 RepID=R8BPL7_PHAM7|nr:putative hydrolase protein [Phaeoacremonium minimum UCRPA7]EOO01328.1 putative hydrolase protein [Phaeoacremonium minimum UCRPA7]